MGWIIDLSEKSGDVRRFDEAIKRAKSGVREACEIWEDMKQEFSERGGSYGERYMPHGDSYSERHYPMMSERDWAELQERRRRDSMGRYM